MISIREFEKKDSYDINRLYHDYSALIRGEAYRKWFYEESPFKTWTYVATSEDLVVGYITAMKSNLNYYGREVPTLFVTEAAVDEAYQSQGIYKSLCEHLYEEAKRNGCTLRYEFPLPGASIAQTNHLNATYIADVPIMLRIFNFKRYLKARMKNKTMAGIMGTFLELFRPIWVTNKKVKKDPELNIKRELILNESFTEFWEKVKKECGLTNIRSKEFIEWRFKKHPHHNHYVPFSAYRDDELVGYVVLKYEVKEMDKKQQIKMGFIVDFIAETNEVARQLLKRAHDYSDTLEVNVLTAWVSDYLPYKDVIYESGYKKTKLKIGMVGEQLKPIEDISDDLMREKNWFITPTDSDIY